MSRCAFFMCAMTGMTVATLVQTSVWAQGAELFRGKEISLLIGAGPAGGYDISGRLLARHYGRFLPGTPSVVAKNVPGASGLSADPRS